VRLTRQRVHWNVAGGSTTTLLIRLDAPHNTGAVTRPGDQIRAAIVERYAGDDIQVAGNRGHRLALVQIVHPQGIIPDSTGVQQLAIRAHGKELRVRRLRGVERSKDTLSVPLKKFW